jgi:hypothetical protein
MSEIVGTMEKLVRLNCSASGNPRFRITLTDGQVFETQADAAINYDIENWWSVGVSVRFQLSRDGRAFRGCPV